MFLLSTLKMRLETFLQIHILDYCKDSEVDSGEDEVFELNRTNKKKTHFIQKRKKMIF